MGLLDAFYNNADAASSASREAFPNQEWDNSQRNALRHSMWIGGMAKQLGAGPDSPYWNPVAQNLAKGVGYANEGVSYIQKLIKGEASDPAYKRDTLHDLNANAVGAEMAGYAKSPDELRRVLTNMAFTARRGQPVGLLSMSDGQLSYDPNTGEQTQPILLSKQR